jgi:hypothetical protein
MVFLVKLRKMMKSNNKMMLVILKNKAVSFTKNVLYSQPEFTPENPKLHFWRKALLISFVQIIWKLRRLDKNL